LLADVPPYASAEVKCRLATVLIALRRNLTQPTKFFVRSNSYRIAHLSNLVFHAYSLPTQPGRCRPIAAMSLTGPFHTFVGNHDNSLLDATCSCSSNNLHSNRDAKVQAGFLGAPARHHE
jgi:hypothetical protein